jgi:hypothetical protein
MNEHAPGILFPRLPQLFSAQPVLQRDLLHSIVIAIIASTPPMRA